MTTNDLPEFRHGAAMPCDAILRTWTFDVARQDGSPTGEAVTASAETFGEALIAAKITRRSAGHGNGERLIGRLQPDAPVSCGYVRATCDLVSPDGRIIARGYGGVTRPRDAQAAAATCPPGHAAMAALEAAGGAAAGTTAHINYWRICPGCEAGLVAAGVVAFVCCGTKPEGPHSWIEIDGQSNGSLR